MANRLKFTPDGKFVFISVLGGGDLVVLDPGARKEHKRIALWGGGGGDSHAASQDQVRFRCDRPAP
jgi:hypothetical protein